MKKTVFGNTSLSTFDVIVIGSGAGGGTIAYVLTAQGLKVLVLEAGPCYFDNLDDPANQPVPHFSNDELKLEIRNFIVPDPRVEPRSWRTSESDGDRLSVGDVQALPKTVGGGSVHADLKMPRYAPTDFQLGTLLGSVPNATFADWPVQYDELEPFYAWGERLLGVQGKMGANPFEGPRSSDYPMAPGAPMYGGQVVGQGLASLGYTMFPYPTAVNSVPYDGRPACNDCGFCSGYGCPTNAKGSSAVTMLRKALLSGNCQLLAETRVVKIVTNAQGTSVTSVEALDPTGKRVTYTADRYVLAASPIEDARLLLLSDPTGVGLGNSSGQVGRNLMFHYQTDALGIFNQRVHGYRGRAVAHGFADFRGAPNDSQHPLGGIVEISGGGMPVSEAAYYKRVLAEAQPGSAWNGALFKDLMRQSPGRDRVMILVMQAEDAPQSTNRVDLDPAIVDLDGLPVARCTYQNHAFELSASAFYQPKLIDILVAAGAHYAFTAPPDAIPESDHIMGTLRFGADPTTSVCNQNGQLWDIGNLFVGDGALFPTSAGYNPTMTITALALRVGAAMVNSTSPESLITLG
jgi:choline dehydrogenase-like flavoprotein